MTTPDSLRRLCRLAFAPCALALLLAFSASLVRPVHLHASAAREDAPASASASTGTESGGESVMATVARVVNFAALVGILVYFLRKPFAQYLATRKGTIGKELVDAKALRDSASQRLRAVETRRAELPGEIETLRIRGREELARERVRMKEATAREREKVLDATRREIDVQFRGARRELVAHAAEAAMKLAQARIEASMTADDQTRLVDRYVNEVRA